jgi:hypothetical protein
MCGLEPLCRNRRDRLLIALDVACNRWCGVQDLGETAKKRRSVRVPAEMLRGIRHRLSDGRDPKSICDSHPVV